MLKFLSILFLFSHIHLQKREEVTRMLHKKIRTIIVILNISALITHSLLKGEGIIMMHKNLQAIILAAGKSTRFGTGCSKLLAPLCGQAMVVYPARLFHELGIEITVVTGHQKEEVEALLATHIPHGIQFVHQLEQRGTGHALLCTKDTWSKDHILIINGDMPLVSKEIITKLYARHTETDAAVSFVTCPNTDASANNYGRIVQDGTFIKIVEASDFKGEIPQHYPLNAGIYLISKDFLINYCNAIEQNKTSNEFYLTDLIGIASNAGQTVCTMSVPFDRIRGINTLQELAAAEQIKRTDLMHTLMAKGVRFIMPQTTHIDLDVTIGKGTVIGAGVQLLGKTIIGEYCTIHPCSILENAILEDNVIIDAHSMIRDSTVHAYAQVGPYAHLRMNTEIHERAQIGNFVEIKKSSIGAESKAKHLAYLGDATIGTNVNIGAGSITCNYDGKNKHITTIKDGVFIGSNNTLIPPLTIEKNAYTAAGSTITDYVPEDALAIGRARQVIKEGYARKLRGSQSSNSSEPAPASQGHDASPTYACAKPTTQDSTIPEEL